MDELDEQLQQPEGLEVALRFLADGSRGFGHNRHRSRLARRLKHVELSPEQADRLVTAILAKLRAGDIDEQFMDQLRLCRHLAPERSRAEALTLLNADKEYVRRYARRLLGASYPRKP